MLRAIWLVFQNEFRLLLQDRTGAFMLLLAPIVIIAVAGFSLGGIYGAHTRAGTYLIPVINRDDGAVGQAVLAALRRQHALRIYESADLTSARRMLESAQAAPLAVLIPAGTSDALKAGHPMHLTLYVDPVKRLEANAIELRLSKLCAAINAHARDQAQRQLDAQAVALRAGLEHLNAQLSALQASAQAYSKQLRRARDRAQSELEERLLAEQQRSEALTRATIEQALAQSKSTFTSELAPRRAALSALRDYLLQLQSRERDFDRWLVQLKAAAGRHADAIPPPPRFPAPPRAQLAELAKPLDFPAVTPTLPSPPRQIKIRLPEPPPTPGFNTIIRPASPPAMKPLPGQLGWRELGINQRRGARVNAFDQYVPGFGITFLLIGMLMGISLGLIDERDWGTLRRLRASGAPFSAILIGKLLSRFLVGLAQLIVLFVIGWWLFGVSLGPSPVSLLAPAAAISFAAVAFGLLIACIARTHDSVMPVGAVVAMAMSAIGGCWWPIDFEPPWMRAVALSVPTSWSMRAFNDLMIRQLPVAAVVWPCLAAAGLGVIYLVIGLAGASRLYD
ncbi:MAG: ABC transporter permease [Candidatus Binataceae bacterium]